MRSFRFFYSHLWYNFITGFHFVPLLRPPGFTSRAVARLGGESAAYLPPHFQLSLPNLPFCPNKHFSARGRQGKERDFSLF